ncbi:C40 family peptidase [Tahibacter harae]|uniref:SH3 domain-containing protein n=1 Tax=Tahibacter harae TaxID=2963937 RepID=A0ABT1QMJ6_9GAMM|nr:SH3 domain-containing protein [Tahibacter harae]MCQ4163748.1 SH3 domain-containing protein [Tahibacter harae]
MRAYLSVLALVLLAACTHHPPRERVFPPHGVPDVEAAQLDADYWIQRQHAPQQLLLSTAAIAAQNRRLFAQDRSMHDLEALPAQLPRATVAQWLGVSARPRKTLYDERGAEVPAATLDALVADAAADALPEQIAPRHGLVVRRADLRAFPTRLRVFSRPGDTDIDRFQESALFPGTPVRLLHASRDGRWLFVLCAQYAAWIEADVVAEGEAAQVFGYGRKTPYRIVTGAMVRTVFTPQPAAVSELQLDMGVRVPVRADWPPDQPVNGQHPYTSHVIELPLRNAQGRLEFTPALLPRSADTAPDYLPLTTANLLRQSFKFLGERYGWGHSYNARDCSGFVGEVYRSFGVLLPRNTRDMGTSPAFDRIALDENDSREKRLALLQALRPGDLVFIPGHVMMNIGNIYGEPYVIHDTSGITYTMPDGRRVHAALNGVAVTPLTPLLGDEAPFVDRIYSIQRIRN